MGVAGGVGVNGVVEGGDDVEEATDVVGEGPLHYVVVLLTTARVQHLIDGAGRRDGHVGTIVGSHFDGGSVKDKKCVLSQISTQMVLQ